MAIHERGASVVVETVVQRESPPWGHRPDEVERLGQLEPGRGDRHEKRFDLNPAWRVEGVARVIKTFDQKSYVGYRRNLRMDHRVPSPESANGQPCRLKRLPRVHRPLRTAPLRGELLHHGRMGEDRRLWTLGQSVGKPCGVYMVDMLMRDQHG